MPCVFRICQPVFLRHLRCQSVWMRENVGGVKLRKAIPAGCDCRVRFRGRFQIFQRDIGGGGGGPIVEVGCHLVMLCRSIANGHVQRGKSLDLHRIPDKRKHSGIIEKVERKDNSLHRGGAEVGEFGQIRQQGPAQVVHRHREWRKIRWNRKLNESQG